MSEVTRLQESAHAGDSSSADQLLPLVYEELRRLAAARMAHEPPGQTLQPTALVHEAWMRLAGSGNPRWNSRAHFFGAAAEAMRRILIDQARRKLARRHGGGQVRVDLTGIDPAGPVQDEELVLVDEAVGRLAAHDPRKAELVKLRYFAGLTTPEAAGILGISVPTADRWWSYCRAWLFQEIERLRQD